MSTRQSSKNVASRANPTLGVTLIAIFCILFGGAILISSVSSLLGITSSHTHPQNDSEVLGNRIGGILIAGMGGYLVLYGLKKLKKKP